MARRYTRWAIVGAVAACVLALFMTDRTDLPFEVWQGHSRSVEAIDWSPDGKYIASGGWDNTVRLWDAESGIQYLSLRGVGSLVTCLAFSRDSRLLAAGTHSKMVRVWEMPAGNPVNWPQVHRGYITALAFSPDGRLLATGSHEKLVILWDVKFRKATRKIWGFRHWVGAVAFSPDSRTLAVGDYDGIRFYDSRTGAETGRVPLSLVHWLRYSPKTQLLAAGGTYGRPTIMDTITRAQLATLSAHGVTSIAFSPDGRTLATSGGTQLKLWDPHAGALRTTLSGGGSPYPAGMQRFLPFLRPANPPPIHAIAYSPDGAAVAAACPDSMIRIWRNLPD